MQDLFQGSWIGLEEWPQEQHVQLQGLEEHVPEHHWLVEPSSKMGEFVQLQPKKIFSYISSMLVILILGTFLFLVKLLFVLRNFLIE